MARVVVTFEAEYDHTKVPNDDGEKTWFFLLVRPDENSQWLIFDWGTGYK